MGSARINAIRQRLADSTYGGMGKFRKQGTDDTSDAVGTFMHNKFNEPNTRSEIMGNVLEDDKECKDEATCGQSSRFLKKKWDTQEYGDMGVKVKTTAGTYVGPGAEHSQAVQYIKDKPVVGHEWLELPDESIVDASAGQFINPEHKPLKQRQRFRIIPKESGLHKYYKKDELLQNMIDTKEGREEIKQIRKSLGLGDDATPKGMKQIKLPNGKIVTVPDRMAKSARIQTARQRLADIFDVIEGGKIKDVEYYDDPPVDKPYYKRFYMKPRTFLDTAAGGAGRKRQEAVTDAHSNLNWDSIPYEKSDYQQADVEELDRDEYKEWLANPDTTNYRGDELGGVEYYKRKLRRGDPIGEPSFTFGTPSRNEGRKRITGHEGRHRARALMEEGVKKIPVKVVGYSGGVVEKNLGNRKKLKGAVEYEEGNLKSDKDTRYPILGRYSKSARIQMARERLAAVGLGKPGITRNERLEKTKEYNKFIKDNPNASLELLDENYINNPDDIIRYDEERAEGIAEPRVESFSKFVPTKITGRVRERGEDFGKYNTTSEPVNVDSDLFTELNDIRHDTQGTSQLSETLEDRRVNKTLEKDRGTPESFTELFTRKFGARGLNKTPAGKELKVPTPNTLGEGFSQAVISKPNAKKWAKLRQRIAEIGRPKQFNFKETLNKHWKLAAKDPRFKAFTHSSSFVGNVKYDQDEQSMEIILNGKTYDFCNVEERLFDSFSGAGSKGAFFNREIKSLHNCGAW